MPAKNDLQQQILPVTEAKTLDTRSLSRKSRSNVPALNADPLKLIRAKHCFASVSQHFAAVVEQLGNLTDADVDALCEHAVPVLKRAKRNAAKALLEMGAGLWAVQTALVKNSRSREFAGFLRKVGLSRTNAYTAINAFVAFRDCSKLEHFDRFAPSALRILGAANVPDEVRQIAVSKAEAGEQITVEVAQELVGKKRPKRIASPSPRANSPTPLPSLVDNLFSGSTDSSDDDALTIIQCPESQTVVQVRSLSEPLTFYRLREALSEALRLHTGNDDQTNGKE